MKKGKHEQGLRLNARQRHDAFGRPAVLLACESGCRCSRPPVSHGWTTPDEDTDSIAYVVLDLSTRSGLTNKLVELCREKCPNAKLIAYGPHVDVNKLHAAKTAGIETVLSNGQFSNQMQAIFDS
ncbi:MAG: hypothetical protein GY924_15195 [Planctomycetaceae bacterium]|nr:hypothetical protein [Planctomycetaceae bacterium]